MITMNSDISGIITTFDAVEFGGSVIVVPPVVGNSAPGVSGTIVLDAAAMDSTITLTESMLLAGSSDIDGDTLSVIDLASVNGTFNGFVFTPATSFTGSAIITYNVSDGELTTAATATMQIIDGNAVITFSYVLTMATVMEPDYSTPLGKGESHTDAITGTVLTRLTDASTDMEQSTQTVNGYSRYSQENSDGTLFLGQGTNSTSSTIFLKSDNSVVAHLAYDDSGNSIRTLGMAHELRWDKTGDFPNRLYFRNGTEFGYIGDVTQNDNTDRSNPTRVILRDFDTDITWPAGATGQIKKIYNDQEGDCSLDCDHWAFMAAYYDGSNYRVPAFIHYQVSTDTVHVMHTSDLAGSNLDAWKNDDYFPRRPNMVEVSPLGTGINIHTGRSYAGNYGAGDADDLSGTWFDGPHLWPLDFDWATVAPFRISISETHSGWAWAPDGRELFVSQDNRRDLLIAVYIAGANKGYGLDSSATVGDDSGAGTIDFAEHVDLSYTGFHFVSMPQNKPGFIAVSTYSNSDEWADDQLIMFEIKDIADTPLIWRIAPLYSKYLGSYWDETPASMSMDGLSVYCSGNWGVSDGASNEVYRYDLETTWHSDLITLAAGGTPPATGTETVYGNTITIPNIQVIIPAVYDDTTTILDIEVL